MMASCEKCWSDSGSSSEAYQALLQERTGKLMCSPEEQAGVDAEYCTHCLRRTIHQHTKQCVKTKCRPANKGDSDERPRIK